MKFVKFFNEIGIGDVPFVGGKNASLGEMFCALAKRGVKVPGGFATTADAYRLFLAHNNLDAQIKKILTGLNANIPANIAIRGKKIRSLILNAELPDELKRETSAAYRSLCGRHGSHSLDVAVRSSATAEDLPDASFAGQQETFLNIRGEEDVLKAVKKCIASLFTDRAISYREDKHFDHLQTALSVGVQKMVRADSGSSGVIFTLDTESGFNGVVLINSIYGLGENIVQGKVNPDEFWVFKETGAIISRHIGDKKMKMVYTRGKGQTVKNIAVSEKARQMPSINDKQILKLAEWAMIIEKHYNRPMDIEWALDGQDGELYILQARPETVHSVKPVNILEEYILEKRGRVIAAGQSVGGKIGSGKATRIMSVKDISRFKEGEVLLTDMTDPDWEPIMKKASAIITDKGGRTCHAAIVSRELGVPCIVGTHNASSLIKSGQPVTVDCASGETGFIYDGILPFKIKKTDLHKLKKPNVKIMLNVGSPDAAFALSRIPNDGVGLAREEFIVANHIRIHPLALIDYDKKKNKLDAKTRHEIEKLTVGYVKKKDFFIDKLAQGVAIIASAFYPKDVIIRLSDFKTNEYASLIGGRAYEPLEQNPMIGWRGASRYYDKNFQEAFEMECAALKKVRDEMKLKNLKIMLPFVRTVDEAKKVIEIMAKCGLKRGENGLELYCMIEIPANIILAEEFAKHFDGFSIGSNDLTQLALGVDRDSELVSHIYDERNQAVKDLISQVIKVAKKTRTKIGICGQAPSDYPDFANFLIKAGIDSISLNPDSVLKTMTAMDKKK